MISSSLASYFKNHTVAAWKGGTSYARTPPYHPQVAYPEYELKSTSNEPNPAYEGIRSCFQYLGLDSSNFNTPQWNPLRDIVRPGDHVVIKPNFVHSQHYGNGDLYSIITHPSVLRAIVDYIFKALKGEGRIIIADAPQMDCNFAELLDATQLVAVQDLYWNHFQFKIEILDLRNYWFKSESHSHTAYVKDRFSLPGDPLGSLLINLGKKSAFYGYANLNQVYGADYDRHETISHHQDQIHEYMISKTVLDADVMISVPKMKVHKKVGVTLNSKGLVGITTNKNFLLHYTLGTPDKGGDQFPPHILSTREQIIVNSQRYLYDLFLAKRSRTSDRMYEVTRKSYQALLKPWLKGVPEEKGQFDGGNWYGNDTAWRMVVDLVRIIFLADQNGVMQETPQRTIFSIVDGIISGERNGPLEPASKETGTILAGFNPLAVDIVGTRLMGFDWHKLKWIQYLVEQKFFVQPQNIKVISDEFPENLVMNIDDHFLEFLAHPGWCGYIEV